MYIVCWFCYTYNTLNHRIGHINESAPFMHFIRQRMKSCDEWDKGLVGHNCECLSNSLILSLYKTMQIWLSKQICTKTNMLGRKDAALSSDCFILVLQRHMIQPLLKTKINVLSFLPSKNWKIQDKVYIVEKSVPWVMLIEIRIINWIPSEIFQ